MNTKMIARWLAFFAFAAVVCTGKTASAQAAGRYPTPAFIKAGNTYMFNRIPGYPEQYNGFQGIVRQIQDNGWLEVETNDGKMWLNLAVVPTVILVSTPELDAQRLTAQARTLLAQARTVLAQAKTIDGAIQQMASENKQPGSTKFTFAQLVGYLPSDLVKAGGNDILGNPFEILTVAEGVRVSPATVKALSSVADEKFWGGFYPK